MSIIIKPIKDGTAKTKYNVSILGINERLSSVAKAISAQNLDIEVCRALISAEMAAIMLHVNINYEELSRKLKTHSDKDGSVPSRNTEIFKLWFSMSLNALEEERLYANRLERKIDVGLPMLVTPDQVSIFLEHIFESTEDWRSVTRALEDWSDDQPTSGMEASAASSTCREK